MHETILFLKKKLINDEMIALLYIKITINKKINTRKFITVKSINSQQNKLIEDVYATIESKIRSLSDEEIDQIFNDISKSINNPDEYDELYILEKLRDKFEDKIIYYHRRLYENRDWGAFQCIIIILIIAVFLMYLFYILVFNYDMSDKKLAAIIQKFKQYGLIIIQYPKRCIKLIHDYLQIIANENLSSGQLLIASKLIQPVIHIYIGVCALIKKAMNLLSIVIVKILHGMFIKYMIFLFLCITVGPVIFIFFLVGLWLWPNNKEYYEKWCAIEKRIEKRIFILNHKQYNSQ